MSKYPGRIVTDLAPAGYSVYFDGNGDFLSTASNAAFAFGTGDFTIEAWINPTSLAVDTLLCGTDATSGAILGYSTTTVWLGSRAASYDLTATYTIPVNTWTHIAVSRQGTTARLFANGVQIASGTVTNNYAQGPFAIGNYTVTNIGVNGYLSNVRAVKGTALYTAAFTPPTQLFNITNTSILTCNSPAFVDQSSNAFALTAAGTPSVSTFTPFRAYVPYNPALGAATPGVWTVDEAMQAAATRQWNMYDPSFNLTTLLLHGNGTNGAQNNTFLDSSSNNFTITRNGNTTQGSFSPFSQTGWSNYFNGTNSDALEIPNNAVFNFGTSDVTVETWLYLNSTSSIQNLIDCGPSSGSGFTSWTLDITASGFIRFNSYVSGNYQAVEATSNPLAPNQWYHIAYTRSSGTNRLFVNGVVCTTTGTLTQAIDSGGNTVTIGRGKYTGFTRPTTGYFSNVRITKGGALYTAGFTPSTAPLTTSVSAGTVSLLTCQSNRFVDNSVNAFTITVLATPSVQAFSPFYPTVAYTPETIGGSGFYDGVSDWLSFTNNSSMDFGTGDFTFETWIYPTALSSFVMLYAPGAVNHYICLLWGATNTVFGLNIFNGASVSSSSLTTPINQWVHVAFVRISGVVYFYINGVASGSGTFSGAFGASTGTSTVGYSASYPGQYFYNGYMRDTRFVKGVGVYTGAFTPPRAPLSTSGAASASAYPSTTNVNTSFAASATSMLLGYTNAGVVDSTGKNVLETIGNAQISTAVSRFGGSSIAFDGNGDYLLGQSSPTNSLGSGDFTVEFWVYPNSVAADQIFIDFRTGSGSVGPTIGNMGGGAVFFQTSGVNRITGSTLVINTWTHIAVTKSGTSTRLFINGTQSGSTFTDSNTYTNPARVCIGVDDDGTPNAFFNGYIDDLRVTRGFARYTGNFTPQTSQWQDQ